MELKYEVKKIAAVYACDKCKNLVEYIENVVVYDGKKVSTGYKHICPNCREEYILDTKYPKDKTKLVKTDLEFDEE